MIKISEKKKRGESTARKQTDSRQKSEDKCLFDSNEKFHKKQRLTQWPSSWNIEPEVFDYSKNLCRIFIGKLEFEDRRMIVFSKPSGDIGIVLTAQEARSLGFGMGLHFRTEQPVKIEKGARISVPEMPKA